MFIVEFYKDSDKCDCEDNHRVYVYDFKELLQLLNYIDKFEYELVSVHKEPMFIGYKTFREFVKDWGDEDESQTS